MHRPLKAKELLKQPLVVSVLCLHCYKIDVLTAFLSCVPSQLLNLYTQHALIVCLNLNTLKQMVVGVDCCG